MRWLSFAVVTVLLAGVGCSNTGKGKEGEKELKLSPPMTATTIERGETKTVDFSITRTKFDEDVDLSFSKLPKGIHIEGGDKQTVEKGQTKKSITLKADRDAELGEHSIEATGKGGGVTTSPATFKINVKEKKEK